MSKITRWLFAILTGVLISSGMVFGVSSAGASTANCLGTGASCGSNVNVFSNAWAAKTVTPSNAVPIVSSPVAASTAQDFIRTGNGPYRYEFAPNGKGTGFCVSDPGGGDPADLGGPDGIEERACNTGNWQLFRIGPSGPGGTELVNVATNKPVTTNGTGAQLIGGGSYTGGAFFTWKGGTSSTTPPPNCEKTSLDRSECGPYDSTTIQGGSNDSGPSVRQEVWNPQPALRKQDLQVWGPANWQVIENAAAGNTEVNSYPDVSDTVTQSNGNPNPISGYSSLVSTYSENMHATSGTDAEAAYDIWLNNYNNELMIWVDNHGQRPAGNDTGQNITVAGNTYRLWQDNGSEVISLVLDHNAQSGTTDILGIAKALQAQGLYSSSAGFDQINFGFEAPSTGGVDETFVVNGYTLKFS